MKSSELHRFESLVKSNTTMQGDLQIQFCSIRVKYFRYGYLWHGRRSTSATVQSMDEYVHKKLEKMSQTRERFELKIVVPYKNR